MGKYCTEIVMNCYTYGQKRAVHTQVYQRTFTEKKLLIQTPIGKSTGHSGSYSTNYQIAGRELMTPDEVRMLDNKYALLFIRGERPVMDFKYDILKHPNISKTTDGKAKPYIHGDTENAVASIIFDENVNNYNFTEFEDFENNYEILSSEEIDEYLEKEIRKNEK